MINYNTLTINAYERGSTTAISNIGFDYRKISALQFETYWPGGLYGTASFYVPKDLATSWANSGAYRVVFYNGLQPVYEGYVDNIDRTSDENTAGILVTCVGAWGNILAAQGINKPWSYKEMIAASWVPSNPTIEEEFDVQYTDGKLHISPNYSMNHAQNAVQYCTLTAPVGQTWKRMTFDYDFKESTGEWEQAVERSTDSVSYTQMAGAETYTSGTTTVITAAATGSIAVTLATPSRYIRFGFYSRKVGGNTCAATDHIHGMIYNVVMYTETDATITAGVVIGDVLAACADLNTSTAYITAPSVDISPFSTDGYEAYADIVSRALGFGGSSGANYYAQIVESDYLMQGADGKPVLQVDAYPAVTSAYEYEIALTDKNLVSPFTLSEAYDKICNYVIVKYRDSVTGIESYVTPDNDATLTDSTSTGLYGRRIPPGGSIDAGTTTSAGAIAFGVRHLVKYKNPTWRLSAPISVVEYIRKGGDIRKPCSEIRSGERVLFSNFPASPVSDPLMGSSPLISIITRTNYSDDGRICSLSFGDLMELW